MCSKSLEGSQTLQNLRDAFAGECMAKARYEYFAQRADIEGYTEIAAAFRQVAQSEEGQALGHLEFLQEIGDPVSNQPFGSTIDNLTSAIIGEDHDGNTMYPEFAKVAREEGYQDVASWFETLAEAERIQLRRFKRAMETMGDA
eukprot:764091-Hanusia_phi.AAC.9